MIRQRNLSGLFACFQNQVKEEKCFPKGFIEGRFYRFALKIFSIIDF